MFVIGKVLDSLLDLDFEFEFTHFVFKLKYKENYGGK